MPMPIMPMPTMYSSPPGYSQVMSQFATAPLTNSELFVSPDSVQTTKHKRAVNMKPCSLSSVAKLAKHFA